MHEQAYEWVRRQTAAAWLPGTPSVLELGGRDINGSIRDLFPDCTYTALDIAPGDGVDIVADAATWEPTQQFDVVVSCETFEHAKGWRDICQTAYRALRPGGLLILTMAGPGRPEHSGVDGQFRLHPGEYYGNVSPAELWPELNACGFVDILVDFRRNPADTRAVAYRPILEGNQS